MLKPKSFLLSILLSGLLLADEYKDVEVYANSVVQHGDIADITGGVVVVYDGDTLKAESGKYDAKAKVLMLNNNVVIISKDGKRVNAKTLRMNLDDNKIVFRDFFLIDKENVWFIAKDAQKQDAQIKLQNALFSSCDVDNPDWSIGFSKAIYDTKSKELRINNAIAYIKQIPVFYFPYLYLPLSHERKTGFLMPSFTYSKDEGFQYSQPFFWAIAKNQDLELDPQIRLNRGVGGFATYRLVDSKDSFLQIRAGYFKDKESYTKKYNLKYKEHYGAELNYINNTLIDPLSRDGYENKLYINSIYMSDTDYLNLQIGDKLYHHSLGSFYDSRVNYYIKNNYFFTGISLDYFKDTTKVSNKETLQILPKLHFHIPYTNIIYNNLSFMVDATVVNYTRESGTKALKAKIRLPLEMHFSLFAGYLNLNISEELEATGYDFYNVPISQKKYSSVVANHKVELSSELSKLYKTGMHTAFFSATYTKSTIVNEKWMKYQDIPKSLKLDFVDDVPFESKVTFRTHQYWHSFDNKLDINYILEAHYYPQESKLRDLEQEIDVKYKNWSFYSKINYSLMHSKTTDVYNRIGYSNGVYGLYFAGLWKRDLQSFETLTKEISAGGYYNYSDKLKFRAKAAYNLKDKNLKNWEVGTYLNRNCWSVDFSFGQNIRPVIKSNGSRGSISNNYFQIQFLVLPFGK